MTNINDRGKHLRENKTVNSSALAEKNNIVILGSNTIKHVNGYEISEKLENCNVFQDLKLDA